MKTLILILFALFTSISFAGRHQVVNPIIQNESAKLFAVYFPGLTITEEMRVACHLLYAEQLIRTGETNHLNKTQKVNRTHIADLLHEYAMKGEYPKNYDYPGERAPCFIDKDKTICAVGYLIEQTEGLEVAQSINETYQYADIFEMDLEFIEGWAIKNGLSLEECAIIQPTYDFRDPSSKTLHFEAIGSLRPAGNILAGLSIMYLKGRWGSKYFALTGAGLNFEFLKNQSYAAGVKYILGFKQKMFIRPIVGMGADYFYTNNRGGGINLTPEAGLHSHFNIAGNLKLSAHLTYGYHFGIVNKDNYGPERHDLSLGIGLGFPL